MSEYDSLRQAVRERTPRVHCITNPVTIQDCANILLACGASPIMAHHPEETAEVSSHSQALVLNMGHTTAYDAMIPAGSMCASLGHPVVLDPVGVGISAFRRRAFLRLIQAFPVTVIRGNASEIRVLEELTRPGHADGGVDAVPAVRLTAHTVTGTAPDAPLTADAGIDIAPEDRLTAANRQEHIRIAQALAARLHCVVVHSGAADLVCDEQDAVLLSGGSAFMPRITGSGCMLSAMMGAYLAAASDRPFAAAAACTASMNRAAEEAEKRTLAAGGGTMTFRMHLIDAVSRM